MDSEQIKHITVSEEYMKAFLKLFSDEYERVYVVNMNTGHYTLTYFSDSNHTAPASGEYRKLMPQLVESHVDEKYRAEFLDALDFDKLKSVYEENEDARISIRYMGSSEVGRYSWKQITTRMYKDVSAGQKYIVFMIKDISDEMNYEKLFVKHELLKNEMEHKKQLHEQAERLKIVVRQTDADIYEWTKEDGYVYISNRLIDNFYISMENENGLLAECIHPDDKGKYIRYADKSRAHEDFAEVVCRVMKRSGEYIWMRISSTNFFDDDGILVRSVSTVLDINEQTEAYNDLKFRASHDKLTGLENADQFRTTASEYMHKDPNAKYAVIQLDINKFRVINDAYGSRTGDDILCSLANALKENVTDGCVCRMYADNFAALVKYDNDDEISNTMEAVIAYMKNYPLDINIMISYGVYKVSDISYDVGSMCDRAGYAKKTIKGNVLIHGVYYDEEVRRHMLEDKAIESEMEYALQHDQFRLYLQPKVNIADSRVIGAEALVRWVHPTKGIIPPGRFIPLFERNSFIVTMDIYIWEQVCKVLRRWIDEGKTPVPISINLSRLHIVDPTLKGTLLSLTERYNIPHELLELEITETAFFDNISELQKCITELKDLGFTVSMDDFGSGYSSLNMLKEVPVDTLKIDRAFLTEVVSTKRGKIVISHTIAMANELNLNVISEGVETVEQAEFLLKNGCQSAQGFLYSKPLSVQNYELYAYGSRPAVPVVTGKNIFSLKSIFK